MKFEIDIDIEKLADLVADRLKAVPKEDAPKPAPNKAPKPAAAPKVADKPKAEAPGGPSREDVHKALRDYSTTDARKTSALGVLHKYAPSLAELAVGQYQEVIDAVKALDAPEPAPSGDDPF